MILSVPFVPECSLNFTLSSKLGSSLKESRSEGRPSGHDGPARPLATLVTMLTVFTVCVRATYATTARFVVEDDSFGSADEIVRLKVLRNTQTGEKVEIVPALGGKTEALLLRTPRGDLREVLLDHHRNATAVHANVGWKGAMLVPYANRIANGTYTLNGVTHYLERNEVTAIRTWDPPICR